jgi:signal transduction histidine kinase
MFEPVAPVEAARWRSRPSPSEFGFLRFVAGMRALLAVVAGIGLVGLSAGRPGTGNGALLLIWPYLMWAGFVLWKTSRGWSWAGSRVWPWLDAALLLALFEPMSPLAPLVAALTLLPVVVLALLGSAAQGTALAVVCAATMLVLLGWHRNPATLPPVSVGLPIVLLALSPAVALLVRPSRELQQRSQFLDGFKQRSDPRQGLRHHVNLLLGQLAARFELKLAVLSVQGPEPRIFRWQPDGRTRTLDDAELQAWRERLETLPRDCNIISTLAAREHTALALDTWRGGSRPLEGPAREVMRALGMHAIAIPLLSYGQPQGQLCLARNEPAFERDDLNWLHAVMREVVPLLERSDLLEQLQRESATRERERIGRDLHDSAVQPYLGLKYGLEALARRTRTDNPVWTDVQQLIELATEELQNLRDVVSGLRSGQEPADRSAPLAALQRQVERFEALYGLKVSIFAPQAPHLRGSVAKAMLHMVNEALTNVRRHTSATAVTVMLDVDGHHVVLRLRNDHGPGEALPRDFVPRSLTERAMEFGGGVAVAHEQDFTEVTITLPLLGAIA